MLTLVLLRHAKSSWNAGGLADYDRPLAKRGQKAAPEIGAALATLGVRPDLVLCSGAARTRETLGLVLAKFGDVSPRVVYDDAIYMATPAALLSLLRKIPDGAPGTAVGGPRQPPIEVLGPLRGDPGGGSPQPGPAGSRCPAYRRALADGRDPAHRRDR